MSTLNLNIFHRGTMRYKATFRNAIYADDGAGGQVPAFSDILTTRCQLIKDSGSEILGTGQIYYNQNFTMRCGYRPPAELPINVDTVISITGPGLVPTTFKIMTFERVMMKSHIYEFKLSTN